MSADAAAKPRVLLMHSVLDPAPAILAEAAEVVNYPGNQRPIESSIRQAAEGCAGICSQLMDPIGEEVLSTPSLKVVANVAVGYDNIDVEAATRLGVMVTNTPGILDETTADFAFTLMAAAARRVVAADHYVRAGNFRGWEIDLMLGQDLHGAVLGLVGMGRIGRAVARRARGFGMRVIYADLVPVDPEIESALGVSRVELEQLLRDSDFVSVHVPLTDETRHLIGAEQLAMMKPSAVLVNTSRGPVLDEAALIHALRNHRIFAAGLDVFENEPKLHPGLVALHNVILSPHIASASVRTRSEMSAVAARNLVTGLRGGRPPHLVNPEVYRSLR